MSEEENVQQEEVEVEIDYKAELEKLQNDFNSVLAKNKELLGETKKAKEAKRALEAEEKEKAAKNGEYEKLLQLEQEEKAQLLHKYETLHKSVLDERLNSQAHKIAAELKAIPESASIVADYVARELKALADDAGIVPEAAINTLKNQFTNDDKYKPLLMGNQSSGGGATGATSSAKQTKEITRADFDSMSQAKRMAFFRDGGKIKD